MLASLSTAIFSNAQALGAATHDKPLEIGSNRQVFIDGRFLSQKYNVELRKHSPVKTGERNIDHDRPWEAGGIGPYSNVIKEDDTYRMWYQVMASVQWHIDREAGAICYAHSKNGIHWEKPNLGLVEFNGSKDNNIVLGHGAGGVRIGQEGGLVFIDPKAPADQKYRMFIGHPAAGLGVDLFSSPDGINWKLTHSDLVTYRPQDRGHHLDSQNVIFYDDRIDKYVFYGRKNLSQRGSQGRSIARGESSTLTGFPVLQEMPSIIYPDNFGPTLGATQMVDYYKSAAIKYPWAQDAYYMFPEVYYHYVDARIQGLPGGLPTNAGPLDSQFAASRDGIVWERYDRRPFVPLGQKGEFDWASARVIHGLVPSVDDRYMYLYYRASDWLHGWDRNPENKRMLTEAELGADQNIAVLSRVVLRKDGFISVRGGYQGGSFTTPVLVFDGSELVLNIDTSATGFARVGIIRPDSGAIAGYDDYGVEVSGFGVEYCDLIHTANNTNYVVKWAGNNDVSALAGKPVRLQFELHNCDLYAFEFRR
jgi:hypothetical protein